MKDVPPIPTVPPDLDRVLDVLEKVYGVDARKLSKSARMTENEYDALDKMVHPSSEPRPSSDWPPWPPRRHSRFRIVRSR